MLEGHRSCQGRARTLDPVRLPTAATGDNITIMSFMAFWNVRSAAIAMLLSLAAASAGAQDSTHVIAMPDSLASWYRDPQTARTLGTFLPGAGHIYAGEKLRGLGFAGAALIGIVGGIALLDARECLFVATDVGCDSNVSTSNRVAGITQIATGVAAWVFGAVDAPRAAQRVNARARQRVSVAPFARDDGVRHAALGVVVTVGW